MENELKNVIDSMIDSLAQKTMYEQEKLVLTTLSEKFGKDANPKDILCKRYASGESEYFYTASGVEILFLTIVKVEPQIKFHNEDDSVSMSINMKYF